MSAQRPAAVIFDLAEVLCRGLPGAEPALAAVFSVPPEEILPGLHGRIMDDYCRGLKTEDAFWTETCARNGWSGDVGAAGRELRENMRIPIDGTGAVLRELAAAGVPCFLLSDHGREWIDRLLGLHDFFGLFRRRFWSFELGSIKRERVTFERVLAELGAPDPAQVVFIDDFPPNIEMARSAGIDAIRFTGAAPLRGELRRRGMEVREAT
jgi:HAD superfamily hydrolase (TIGR01509 family)